MADIDRKTLFSFFFFDLPCKDEYLKMSATVNLVMLKKKLKREPHFDLHICFVSFFFFFNRQSIVWQILQWIRI